MQNDNPMTLANARGYANKLLSDLRIGYTTQRTLIAGSVRRHKPDPGDIEIVCIPRCNPNENLFDTRCKQLLERGTLEKRQGKDGSTAWGEKMKRALYYPGGERGPVPVDLFSVLNGNQWGVIFALRTGPGDFNKLLMTTRDKGGACPVNRRVAGGYVWQMDLPGSQLDDVHALTVTQFLKWAEFDASMTKMDTSNEEAFFKALEVPFIPPQQRTVKALQVAVRDGAWDSLKGTRPEAYFGNSIYGEQR